MRYAVSPSVEDFMDMSLTENDPIIFPSTTAVYTRFLDKPKNQTAVAHVICHTSVVSL